MANFKMSFLLQSDEDCCNTCEEVREAYRRKGWALTNPDLIDQVGNQDFYVSILFPLLIALYVSKMIVSCIFK